MTGKDGKIDEKSSLLGVLVVICGTILPLIGGFSIFYLRGLSKYLLVMIAVLLTISLTILALSLIGRISKVLYMWDF